MYIIMIWFLYVWFCKCYGVDVCDILLGIQVLSYTAKLYELDISHSHESVNLKESFVIFFICGVLGMKVNCIW